MSNTELPKWVWDLIIVMQQHEDRHGQQDPCLKGALAAIPEGGRTQAQGIAAYVKLAQGDAVADKLRQQWGSMFDALFPGKAEPSAASK